MLAFSADDEAHLVAGNMPQVGSWRSLVPFYRFVEGNCRQVQPLHGLLLQLGAVVHETIHRLDVDRLAGMALVDPSAASSEASPRASKTTRTTLAEFYAWRDEAVKDARAVRSLWAAGQSEFSLDALRHDYPRAWAKSARAPEAKRERASPGQFPDRYCLPLCSTSSPVETVAAARAVLAEYAAKTGIAWTGKRLAAGAGWA